MNNFTKLVIRILLIIFIIPVGVVYAGEGHFVETYPKSISNKCRDGIAKVYDECSDQGKIIGDALKSANAQGKSVLVVYGAEWCIWCHVFDKYVKGGKSRFEYKWQFHDGENMSWEMNETKNERIEREAEALNKYVSENFVIAHIDSYYAPNGEEVIAKTGFNVDLIETVPYILVLNTDGLYAGQMRPHNAIRGLEIREANGEEYRGFDRNILLNELVKLRKAAIKKSSNKSSKMDAQKTRASS